MKSLSIVAALCLMCNGRSYSQTNEKDYLNALDKCLYIEHADLKMEVYQNDRMVKYYVMESFRQGDKMRIEFLDPATEKGRKMLNDASNLWMYLPRTSKVLKLPLKQSFMGSDASNRDLMRVQFRQDYDIVHIVQKDPDQIEVELKAKDLSISYNKMIVIIDKQKMVPIRQEMYSLSNLLIKTMTFENNILVEGIYIPTVYKIHDNLQNSTLTVLTYSNMKRRSEKSKDFFSLESLKN